MTQIQNLNAKIHTNYTWIYFGLDNNDFLPISVMFYIYSPKMMHWQSTVKTANSFTDYLAPASGHIQCRKALHTVFTP